MDIHAKVIPLRLHPLGFIEAFQQLGASLDALLHDTGISPHHLDYSAAKISYFQQTILINNGIELCRRPGLGLEVGRLFDISFYGTAGYVIHCSPSLREAAELFRRYMKIAQPYYAMTMRRPDTYADENQQIVYPVECFPISPQYPASLAEFERDYRLATTLRFWDACGNKSVADPSVRVTISGPPPGHADMYYALPCTEVRFNGARSQISAHADFCLKPFREHRRHAFDALVRRCEEELRGAPIATSCAAEVRWHLIENFEKPLTLERVAELMRMTPRQLTRQLALEKTTFRTLMHDVKMELTSYHLRTSRLSIDEISDLMGFSSTSSLRRAIRNWTGEAAGAVRSTATNMPSMA
jgi:AraC-like DNA-binding protein